VWSVSSVEWRSRYEAGKKRDEGDQAGMSGRMRAGEKGGSRRKGGGRR